MTFDIITKRELRPDQIPRQDIELIMVMAERHQRAAAGMSAWAEIGKKSVDYVEGKQWSAQDLAKNEREGRPSLKMNKMNGLLRLVLGYHRQNRSQAKILPDDEGASSEEVAQALTKVSHRIGENNEEIYVETEVVLDGLCTGRGYIDQRLQFDTNMFGEIKVTARDPFSIKLDPDGSSYDLNETCAYVIEDRFVSVDEIEHTYGAGAAALIYPLVYRSGWSGMAGGSSIVEHMNTITPWRAFGGENNEWGNNYRNLEGFLSNSVDTARKTVRLVDMQHKVRMPCRYWADLETGDLELIPEAFAESDVARVLQHTDIQFARIGMPNPIRVIHRMGWKYRWTTMVGDIIVYDKWSPYKSYTMTPFFPYFRRGVTRGMMEDLLDPQDEINKRRSANIDITTRTAHSGWTYHADSLSPEEEVKLRKFGAAPGLNLKWKGQAFMKPEKIMPSAPSQAFERLELRSADDLKEISGVNDSLLGLVDKVQSGRALEARQRQGVMTIQMYMDNLARTQTLEYKKRMQMVQDHYTQARVFRIIGDDGKPETLQLNKKDAAGIITNDVTLGRYRVSVDLTPSSASFQAAQFEELMELVEKGILPREVVQDVAVDISTLPHKDAIKKRLQIMQTAMGMPTIEQLEQGNMPPMMMGPDGQPVPAAQGATSGLNPAIGGGGPPGGAPPGGGKPGGGRPGGAPTGAWPPPAPQATPGHPNAGPLGQKPQMAPA